MCVYMYVCMYMCVCVCVCVCVYIYVYFCVCVCIYIYICVCVCVCVYIYIFFYVVLSPPSFSRSQIFFLAMSQQVDASSKFNSTAQLQFPTQGSSHGCPFRVLF